MFVGLGYSIISEGVVIRHYTVLLEKAIFHSETVTLCQSKFSLSSTVTIVDCFLSVSNVLEFYRERVHGVFFTTRSRHVALA